MSELRTPLSRFWRVELVISVVCRMLSASCLGVTWALWIEQGWRTAGLMAMLTLTFVVLGTSHGHESLDG